MRVDTAVACTFERADMNTNWFILTLSATALTAWPCFAQEADGGGDNVGEVSYGVGVQLADALRNSGKTFEIESLIKGFRDAFENRPLDMDRAEIDRVLKDNRTGELDQYAVVMKDLGERFLRANARAEGVVVLESGLQYKVLKEGTGKIPAETDRVKTHYRGALLDGSEIDNTYRDDRPADIGVYQVFPGWKEALQKMPVGSKWRIFIPSELAYGEKGAGKKIPPHSVLIFEIETLEIITQHLQDFR